MHREVDILVGKGSFRRTWNTKNVEPLQHIT